MLFEYLLFVPSVHACDYIPPSFFPFVRKKYNKKYAIYVDVYIWMTWNIQQQQASRWHWIASSRLLVMLYEHTQREVNDRESKCKWFCVCVRIREVFRFLMYDMQKMWRERKEERRDQNLHNFCTGRESTLWYWFFFSVVVCVRVCIFGQFYINHKNVVTEKAWNKKI